VSSAVVLHKRRILVEAEGVRHDVTRRKMYCIQFSRVDICLFYKMGNENCLSGVCGPGAQKKVSSGPHTPDKQFAFPIEIEAF
jgi:hypothetical protein